MLGRVGGVELFGGAECELGVVAVCSKLFRKVRPWQVSREQCYSCRVCCAGQTRA